MFLDSDDKNRGHAWPCRGQEVDTSLAWWHRHRYWVSALGPRTQEANGSPWLVVLGSGFHKIVVPCSQIQMIKRANIPSTYYVSSLECLWVWKLAWVYSQAVECTHVFEGRLLIFFKGIQFVFLREICMRFGSLNCQWYLHFSVKKPIVLPLVLDSMKGKQLF